MFLMGSNGLGDPALMALCRMVGRLRIHSGMSIQKRQDSNTEQMPAQPRMTGHKVNAQFGGQDAHCEFGSSETSSESTRAHRRATAALALVLLLFDATLGLG
jgi:hypothetical protein